jgi:fatty-acyl-CoA synthase
MNSPGRCIGAFGNSSIEAGVPRRFSVSQLHHRFWPKNLPRTLTLPETGIYYNLEVTATRHPHKAFTFFYGQRLNYADFKAEADALAGYLQQKCDVRKGDRVLLDMQNSPQFMIAYYAILRAEAVVVPINPMNLTEELQHYIEDSDARVAIVGQELYSRIKPLLGHTVLSRVIVAAYGDYAGRDSGLKVPDVVAAPRQEISDAGVTPWHEAVGAGLAPAPNRARADDAAVLLYTSGTTGKPKGCVHTHRSTHATLIGGVVGASLTPDATVLAAVPLFHVTGMQHCMSAPIFSGAAVVIMTRWDRDTAAELIKRHGVTHWTNIPTMVIDLLSSPRVREFDLSSLLSVGGGGASMPEAIAQRLSDMSGLDYLEGYGLSETMSQTHWNPRHRPKKQCLGIPCFDVDSRVVNPDTLEELAPGEVGEIISSGPQVMREYWKNPEATREAFVERDGKRFLRTGDLGYYDEEGYFFIVDRLKRMINAAGFKVWPAEVESIMYKNPDIAEACIVGIRDPRKGEAVKAIVALKETSRGKISEQDVVAWAKANMAAYKAPTVVEFVDSVPKSATGKVQWRLLQERERARTA